MVLYNLEDCFPLSSVTIRVPKRDKERLQRLAKRIGKRKLSDVFRFALYAAERETDTFRGNMEALLKGRKSARAVGDNTSENLDPILADVIYDEGKSAPRL
jgi:predicted DNA-binding protein